MAVSKSKEKERLEKERIKKVGEKLLKEQMANKPDVKKETQKLMSESSTNEINRQKQNLTEVQSRIINAEKNTKPFYNSDKPAWDKQIVFKSNKDMYQYSSDTNNLGEYKDYLDRTIERNKTMKPLDYGKEAVENINRKNKQDASNSMRYPNFKSNPTSRTKSETMRLNSEKNTGKIGNFLFGANNKLSAWADKGRKTIEKDIKERQKKNYLEASEEYYNPGFGGNNKGYKNGRPVNENVSGYKSEKFLLDLEKKGKKEIMKKYGKKK